jgi:hypothetical protein
VLLLVDPKLQAGQRGSWKHCHLLHYFSCRYRCYFPQKVQWQLTSEAHYLQIALRRQVQVKWPER